MTGRFATAGVCVVAGLVPGLLLAGIDGGILGGMLGAVTGLVAARFEVRTAVAAAVTAGAVTGAFIGRSVVAVICLPETCAGLEAVAAVLTGIGAFLGVGIIAALVTRSFDEFREGREVGVPCLWAARTA